MDKREFIKRVEHAIPGERIVYHKGLLAADRLRSWDADLVGELAWVVGAPRGDFGRVEGGLGAGALLQTRIDPGSVEYALTMRRRLLSDEVDYLRSIKLAA